MCNMVHLSVRLKMHWAIVNHMISVLTIIHNMSVGLRMYLLVIERGKNAPNVCMYRAIT